MHFIPFTIVATVAYFTSTTLADTITVTQSASPTSTSSPSSDSYTNSDTFQSSILTAHNFYRSAHNASSLTWNSTSATFANTYSSACNFKHSGHPTGENLAAGYANATASIDAWALERKDYNWNKPGFSEETGHFTQLVWSNTTSVGCGRTNCNGKNGTPGWYVVCEYYPQGNIVAAKGADGGEGVYFKQSVGKQVKGKATDTVESGVTSGGSLGGARKGLWEVVGLSVAGVVCAVLL